MRNSSVISGRKNFNSLPIWLLLCLAFLLNCVKHIKYTPDPERDIEKWIQNFVQQRSFSYRYKLQTQSVYSTAKGDCIIGRGEHVRGIWNYEDSKLKFEYVGVNDIEYSKKNGKWYESPRGEESDVITQLRRILKFDKFEFIGSEKKFLYRFKANIPFLAPGRRKEMIGLIKISRGKFLPELIWTGLPDSSIYWEIELYNFNKKKSIKAPVRVWNKYVLIAAGDYLKAVKRRLKLIDINYRIKKSGDDIVLTMPKHHTIEDIKMLLSTGTLHVYGLTESKTHATKVGYLRNDSNMPLFLVDRVLDQNDIKDAKIKFDVVSKPFIEISLKKKYFLPSAVAFEVDGIILDTTILDTSEKIDRIRLYTDMQYYEMQILRASLLQSLPSIALKPIAEERN